MKKIAFILTSLFASIGAAQAQTQAPAPSPVQWSAGIGISGGGDDLATAEYTNGRSQDITAGGGVYFTAGANYRFSPAFSVQGSLNFHVDDTNADNGSIKFKRFPVEVLGYYHLNDAWRVGAGVRYVSGAKLSSSGAAAGLGLKFDNTVSGVVEAEYFWSPQFGVKLRYVNETFEAARYLDVKASHVGISANYYF